MPDDQITLPAQAPHMFRGLRLDAYSLDLPDEEGQVGDRASHRAFDHILAEWRQKLARNRDPLGPEPEETPEREALDEALLTGAPDAAGLVQAAIEDYAGTLVDVVRRFLMLPEWQGTQRLLVGGGLRSARFGEVAITRAAALIRAEGIGLRVAPIRHDPDEAGLIGAARLVPMAVLQQHDAVLTADLGGTSFRAGVVLPRLGVSPEMASAGVWRSQSWRHADEKVDRVAAIGRLAGMLNDLAGEAAATGLDLAPVVALGLPGVIDSEGRIERGAENLPGNWQAPDFRLAHALAKLMPLPGGGHPAVLLHNDAVCQGLSEAPFLRDVARWGVLTIGTGLGNARFTNLPLRE